LFNSINLSVPSLDWFSKVAKAAGPFAIAVSIGRSNRTASSVRIYFGAAAIGDKINLLIVK
jgi:hypothetical protein